MHRLIVLTLGALWTVTVATAQEKPKVQPPGGFGRLFDLPGVELSKEQKENLDKLRKQFAEKAAELGREVNRVYSPEQRRARRAALEAARKDGKSGRELRQAAEKAVKLAEEQQKRLSDLRTQRERLLEQTRGQVTALLTKEQQQRLRRRGGGNRQPGIRPTHANVKYGPPGRNVMDVWLAKSDAPTPLLVSIHGGGFRGGNKGVNGALLRECLEAGISVAAITYRLSGEAIAPAQFHDSARAIQFLRHNAAKWNLDGKRVAATGGSAGAGLSLWLGFHDDLADPDSDDPVLRQSTRLSCMAVYNGQTSYDPRFIRKLFPGSDTYKHSALAQLYDVDLDKLDDLPQAKYRLFEEVSALPHLSKDDAPALLCYASQMDAPIRSQGVGIHHPRFGKALKEKMDPLGVECRVETGVRRGDPKWVKLTMDFVKKHLK